jgi:hypothetical protein
LLRVAAKHSNILGLVSFLSDACDKCKNASPVSFRAEPEEAWRAVVLNRWHRLCLGYLISRLRMPARATASRTCPHGLVAPHRIGDEPVRDGPRKGHVCVVGSPLTAVDPRSERPRSP